MVERVEELAASQGDVLSRGQAGELGADRHHIAHQVRVGRWLARGSRTVAIHRGPLPPEATRHSALFEVGAGAALDGATALQVAGLERFEAKVHVSMQHGRRPGRPPDVVVHELIAWREEHVIDAGIRRVRPEVAAVRAAAWAVSDRQAALVLLMTAQQKVALPERMLAHAEAQLRLRRRELIEGVLADTVDGAQSLGELDFARLCRQRGLPEPSRQVVRRRPSGRAYLDVVWEDFGVAVEIDGIHHLDPENAMEDQLRQNDLVLLPGSESMLRVMSWALRVDPAPFLDQLEELLVSRGARLNTSKRR
ncbi:MAG TPA: hypothetical protein VFJ12_00495 [Segeticoccus sp.]|nr:hypothetical protein [Segeticoccus sp.]